MMVIKEDTMKNSIYYNDLVFIEKNINIEQLNEKDIIAININENTTISRIYQISNDKKEIVVKGDNNLHINNKTIDQNNLEGKIVFKIPWIGFFISILETKFITIIFIIILILRFLLNKEIYRRRKKLFVSIDKTTKT